MPEDDRSDSSQTVAAIVLAGGGSTRMGRHKPAIEVDGRAMVARVVDAAAELAAPRRIVVVGHPQGVPVGVRVVSESPPGGGPVAALAAGLAALHDPVHSAERTDIVLTLAADVPLLTSRLLRELVSETAVGGIDLVVAVDDSGQRNWLVAAWRTDALERELARLGPLAGQSLRRLAQRAAIAEVRDGRAEATDVDTPEDLGRLRQGAVADG